MALPIAAMNIAIYIRAMISVFCLGRLGSLELAGGALAIGFITIFANSVLFGLASGLDSVCSQAHGCNNSDLVVSSLHRMILVLLITSLPITLLCLNISKILLWAGQDGEITAIATTYIFYSLPYLLIHSFLQPIRAYLRSRGTTKPMMYCSAGALVFDVQLNLLLVFVLKWGVPGVAIAALLSDLNMVVVLVGYLYLAKGDELRWTWRGWSVFKANEVWPLVALAVPSCCGICLEWWCYEIMTVVSGYLRPEPRVAGRRRRLSCCASTRVGNELGAGKPGKAKFAAMVSMGCAFLIGLTNVGWTRPAIGARIGLISFYAVGTPLAIALTFWLGVGYQGIWSGLLPAEIVGALSVLLMVMTTDWEVEAEKAKKLAATVHQLETHLLLEGRLA